MWLLVAILAALSVVVALLLRPLQGAVVWLSEKPNPVLQLMYLTLVFGIFYVYQVHAFPLIEWHRRVTAWAAVLVTSLSFMALCYSDSGRVTRGNHESLRSGLPVDELIYDESRTCDTCQVRKIARSKHCSVCGYCVPAMDHHCFWSNACISHSNKGRFLVFLVCTFVLCFYCVFQCLCILVDLAHRRGIPIEGLWDFLVLFFLRGGVYRNMALVTLVAGGAVLAFFLFHFRLAIRNITTNEYVKRRRAANVLENAPPSMRKDSRRALSHNPYDRGSWWANLKQLFF